MHLEVSIGKGGYQEAKRLVGGVNRMVGNSCWSKTNLVMMFDDKAAASDDDDADVDTLGARAGVFNETGRNCRCRGLITHHRHHQPPVKCTAMHQHHHNPTPTTTTPPPCKMHCNARTNSAGNDGSPNHNRKDYQSCVASDKWNSLLVFYIR